MKILGIFRRKKSIDAIAEGEFLWCIVGNIVDKHHFGELKEIRRGTKHFSPGTKVYCIPEYGSTAHDRMRVIGKPRTSNSMINVIIETSRIKNFRLQKVYSPTLFDKITDHSMYRINNNYRISFEELNRISNWLGELTEEL
jgi:hypothetical protein